MTFIRGGGGGPFGAAASKARTPEESPDSLLSTSYAKVLDVVSEGEIFGLTDSLKSVFLNNTPIQNLDGSYNFQDVSIENRPGSQSQLYVPGFDSTANETGVGVTVVNGAAVTRTITNTSVNAVRVTISIPTLQWLQEDGDIRGATVQLRILVQYNGGGFTEVINDTIRGRTSQLYQKQYLVEIKGAFPVGIRVERVTANSTSIKLVNDFSWSSYTEVSYAKLSYANSALFAVRFSAEQFNSIPSRSYRIKGIKVKIPSNGTVNQTTGAISYSGIWNGTFGGAQWTSDPAWCLWDLLVSTRYGTSIDETKLDKWSFYAASVYCAESVPDGFGGYEPRFSCNVNIQTSEDVFRLINNLCSVFRAMPYWSAGALTVSQDKPADPAYLFTYANVTEAGFSYSGSSLKTRPTVAVVSYQDLALRDQAQEVVEDSKGIAKYGIVKTEITAFACTSRGQAHRLGEWLLYSGLNETEVCTFTASVAAGVIVRPGQIISIMDPVRAGARRGGLITSATTTAITVDDATGLAMGTSTMLSVILPDGTVQARAVSSIVGRVVTVSAFTSAPNPNSVWMLQTAALLPTTWRVLGVVEEEECNYAITCLAYDSAKYAFVERGVPLQPRSISNLNNVPAAPTNLSLVEALYEYTAQVHSKIIVTWQGIPGVNQYLVKWRANSGNWTTTTRQQQDYEIFDTAPGLYEFEVYSLSAGGQPSGTSLTGSLSAVGKTAPPSNVTGFIATLDKDVGVTLSWNAVPDLDILCYQIYQSENGAPGIKLGEFTATSKKLGIPVLGTTTWTIVATDTSYVSSLLGTSTSLTVGPASAPTTSGLISGGVFVLTWTAVAGSLATDYYDVRYGTTASTYATATPLATVKGTTQSVEVDWGGARRFFVATVDTKGNYGAAATYDAVVAAPGQPVITQQVIDNNVLLQWTDATSSLPIVAYELRKGATWASATYIGTKQGRFTTVFEFAAGTYTYWLAGIDSAGNYGTPGSVSALVSQPPDYVLKLNVNSTFAGTKTNLAAVDGGLLASVSATETWAVHFSSRSWTTLAAQAADPGGFPILVMPSQTTGRYVEDIDYGALQVAGLKINATLTSDNVVGATVVTPTIYARGTTATAATYARSTTTVTVTSTAHGLTAGRLVFLTFTSGGALNDSYLVVTAAANTFTVTTVASGTIAAGNSVSWVPWTTYAGLSSVFASNFRYIRIQYDFASAGGNDLVRITALNVRVDSKLRNDSGKGTAVSTDAGGTVVSFSYPFIDVESIAVTPATTTPVIAVYDFVDVANPTSFKVLLFDTAGARVSGPFSWSARGV